MNAMVRFIIICGICFGLVIPQVHAQSDTQSDRQLKILDPADEVQDLDPAFEMIMEKVDGDLRHVLSSPKRLTPRGTAITGLTLIGTIFLLDQDEDYLADIGDPARESSDDVFERLRVLGRSVPDTTAGLYLLGYFIDSKNLKSSSLEALEAEAITALITACSAYVLGRQGPQDSSNSDDFEPFSGYNSLPDMDSALVFSMASVYAFEKPLLEALLYYGIATGTAYSRLYFQNAWPSDVFLGSILGAAIGRAVAARSRNGGGSNYTLIPVLEQNGNAAMGLRVEFKL